MGDHSEELIRSKVKGQHVTFHSDSLALEGILNLAEDGQTPGLVLCHPHPLQGGTMNDSRIQAISLAAFHKGLNTLCFNFRGVGASQGSFSQGAGEVQDTISAVQFLRTHPHVDAKRVAIFGYSFGGSIALAAALDADPAALVLMSAALRQTVGDPSIISDTIRYIRAPTYILHGRNDDVIPYVEAEAIYAQLQMKEKYLRIIRGADHFWFRRLDEIIPMIIAFLTEKLQVK